MESVLCNLKSIHNTNMNFFVHLDFMQEQNILHVLSKMSKVSEMGD